MKQQLNAGRRKEIYYFRDQQGLEVDLVVPAGGRALTLVEATASRTVTPGMADPLVKLRAAANRDDVTSILVHRGTTPDAALTAVRPGVQNRDGGVPTFCRGWGTLPFDRSTPEITAHALRAWSAWHDELAVRLQQDVRRAAVRALSYLEAAQRPDGSWVPLWFGNERTAGENNPVYGTARVLLGLDVSLIRDDSRTERCRRRAIDWLLDAQSDDGGWGGDRDAPSSMEETGVALSALGRVSSSDDPRVSNAIQSGVRWLCDAMRRSEPAAPLGLYFARLWYYEALYPLIFALEGLAACARVQPAGALSEG